MSSERQEIRIDTSQIPDYIAERLAAATWEYIRRLRSNPETRAELERRVARRKEEQRLAKQ